MGPVLAKFRFCTVAHSTLLTSFSALNFERSLDNKKGYQNRQPIKSAVIQKTANKILIFYRISYQENDQSSMYLPWGRARSPTASKVLTPTALMLLEKEF